MVQTPPSYGFGRYGFWFFGPRIAFRATGALWGRATPSFYHFSVHLSSVLGRTELCHEVWTPGPQKTQIISNENHHLALLEWCCSGRSSRELSGPFSLETPHFHVRWSQIVRNCSRERSLEPQGQNRETPNLVHPEETKRGLSLPQQRAREIERERDIYIYTHTGRPRFGSVRLRFGGGRVRAVPVFGSGGSYAKGGFLCFSTV